MSNTQVSQNSSSTLPSLSTDLRTVLVTGGGGYVGSHTIIELLQNNYAVIVVDNLLNCYAQQERKRKPESLKRIEKLTGKSVLFYQIDVGDPDFLGLIFENVVVVFLVSLCEV